MGSLSRSLSTRVRWAIAFALLLLAASAVPVLAESPPVAVGPARVADAPETKAEPIEAVPPAPEQQEIQPEAGQVAEQVESIEREEVAKAEWLESPEAIRQREESRTAFDGLSTAEAEGVLGSAFQEMLKQLDGDPARALSDFQIEEVVSENGALVANRQGGSELVESPIPIRSQVPGEEGKPVDLALKESEGGFESKTPSTEIRLPASLGGQIEVSEELAISSLPGDTEVSATRFGDKDLFFANAETDTDTFLAPLARSVEVFQQLRSPKSPEQFRYGLTLPKGTELRADGQGGAEVVDREGKRFASIPAPLATDAQGTDVPVSMVVDGDSVVVEIAHRSRDVAYPLLVDPELVNDSWYWEGGNTFGLAYWGWQETADYENGTWCVGTCWGNGLYARSKGSNYLYGGNTWGQWVYTAANSTAYISAATFWTLHGNVNNCPTYQPHGYVGIYNVYSGSYNSLGIYSPPSFYAPSFETGWVGGNGTRLAVVGIGTGSGASQLACAHDFFVGGVMLNQDDPEAPGVSVGGMPGGWISDAAQAFTITSNGSDPGLGVRKTTFTRDGQPIIERPVGCNGTAASRCPANRAEYFNVSALSFDEGKNKATITVEDATAEKSSQTWQTYVDMTKPDIVLNGQLAVATEEDKGGEQGAKKVEELSLPVYSLDIKATDIGTESDADKKKRSGVRKIEVRLDGVKKEAWEQPCADSCPMEKTYSLKLNNLSAGEHVLEVIATDGVEKKREREIEFEYIPATGMKDEYVMQYFPLPDGEGDEAAEENPDRPELAVNVMNGNLVYREKDVDVEGYGVNLEVERYYNSLLPEGENTEWGDGWTLAQSPDLQPEEGPGAPAEAMMVRSSGAVEGAIELPAGVNEEVFDPELQAVVTKEADGGYEVADATGETDTAIAFDEGGTVEELRTEGAASVEYDYDAGDLAEIEVDDPASTSISPREAAELAEIERMPSSFNYAFGLQGSADGQFKVATDVAIDPTDSTIWVADDENDRVQHFTAEGAYLGKFASCYDPGAVDVDLQGDIYVACTSADKIQKFNDKGTFLKQIAGAGPGNGQVRFPLDLALDAEQNLYVADTNNSRVQKLDAAGTFVKSMPVGGSPWGVDVAPDGNIWTAEAPERRVSVFNPQGTLLFRFGSQGSGHSQFERPVDVEVDDNGFAWVSDAVNNRIQVFDSQGSYVTQFGQKGTGNGQLNTDWWLRLAVGSNGDVWVTDQGNSRLHKWRAAGHLRPSYGSRIQDDPEVEIESPGGLVASVDGEEAGEHVYEHDGDLLTSYEDEDGETSYEYDGSGRMTRVELPNGTWAKIEYGSTDGRVKKVTVAPAGTGEKSTQFTYTDKPRKTVVTLPSAPVVTYDIGEDGSVLKWQNALKPPEFEAIAGTLYDVANKETATPINAGDHNLSVKAYSEEGIAKIQMYANGDQLISESTCPQVYTEPAKCKKLPDEWVTNTGSHAPGILNLEMVIEDRIGQVASKRFWVNIPYTPPPPPDQPVTPKFAEVLKFREDHGLDLDLDPIQDEFELNDRVFDTINDWIQGNPVAEASMERWGAPLRTPEVAELEYRLAYWRQASEVIPGWVTANAASTFAGFYLDERAGGKVVVGFTGSQGAVSFAALEQTAGLMVGPERIVPMAPPPTHTLAFLESLRQQVSEAAAGYPPGLITRATVDVVSNSVSIGASNVVQAQALLQGSFGTQAPIDVHYLPNRPERKVGRERIGGMVRAGDEIIQNYPGEDRVGPCTASFGAFDKAKKPGSGDPVLRLFALTAGHCEEVGEPVWRRSDPEPTQDETQDIGVVGRSGYETPEDPAIDVDAAAIRLDSPYFVPRKIFQAEGLPIVDVTSVWSPTVGTNLCFSGRTSKNLIRCGPVLGPPEIYREGSDEELIVCFQKYIWGGDSGGPVWVEGTGVAVGIAVIGYGGPDEPGLTPEARARAANDPEEACATLLKPYPERNPAASAFGSADLAPLHLVTQSNAQP